MEGDPRPLRRAQEKEDQKALIRLSKAIEADMEREKDNPQDAFSLGYQHCGKSILRLIDIESGKAMRP